jgi:flagellar biosynthesis protein FlhF
VLKEVRAELGDDAVIISNRTNGSGVEVLAMAANAMNSLVESAEAGVPRRTVEKPRSTTDAAEPESFESYLRRAKGADEPASAANSLGRPSLKQQTARAAAEYESIFSAQLDNPEPSPFDDGARHAESWIASRNAGALPQTEKHVAQAPLLRQKNSAVEAAVDPKPALRRQPNAIVDNDHGTAFANATEAPYGAGPDVIAELRSMKGLLQDQLSQIAWSDSTRRSPIQSRALAKLLHAGFSPLLARSLIEKMSAVANDTLANEWLSQALIQNLKVCRQGEGIVERGGIFALVGPTGVGKTTTTAKLAARAVMRYGAKNVGLITVDHYRVGAHDQLRSFGRMLGCPVHLAHDAEALNDLLNGMRNKHLVLIDTIGVPQRDPRLNEHLSMLMGSGIERVLVLNASSQLETLEDVATTWRGPRCTRAIITKIDEAVKLGGVVDICLRHKLLLDSVANGQRVPEDIHAANSALLVHRSLKVISPPLFQMNEDELRIVATQSRASTATDGARGA